MSDAEQSQEVENTTEQQDIDYRAMYEETQQKLNSLAAHQDKLLTEAKKAKEKKRESEQKEIELRRQQEEQAAKNGEFERLFKQRDKEYKEALEQMNSLKNNYKKEKIEVQAMNVANELADGANAKLLSKFITESLNHLADENGSLSEDVIASVRDDFKTNDMYAALLRQSKSEGGGAPGNTRGAQTKTEISQAEFKSMDASKQLEFINKVQSGEAKII